MSRKSTSAPSRSRNYAYADGSRCWTAQRLRTCARRPTLGQFLQRVQRPATMAPKSKKEMARHSAPTNDLTELGSPRRSVLPPPSASSGTSEFGRTWGRRRRPGLHPLLCTATISSTSVFISTIFRAVPAAHPGTNFRRCVEPSLCGGVATLGPPLQRWI